MAGHSARAHHHHPSGAGSTKHTRLLLSTLAVVAIAVLLGLVLLWPGHRPVSPGAERQATGTVTSTRQDCAASGQNCTVEVGVAIDGGGQTTLTFVPGATDPRLRVGEQIRLGKQGSGAGAVYQFADIRRGTPLLWLALVFAVVVLVVGRLRGLAAMIGLAVAGIGLVTFTIPALLAGESPTAVALVGGAAMALVVLPLAHGATVRTGAALLGTLVGMALAAGLAAVSIQALHFTGTSSDEGATLSLLGSKSSVAGLLICGSVIGAVGVLNDVTVTQASSVFELAAADPLLARRGVFRAAMRIGRDHIASTVYSLVLAYAGAALPLLLLFSVTGQSVTDVLTSDALGPQLAAGLIGATALVLVVPLTTAVATLLIDRPAAGSQ